MEVRFLVDQTLPPLNGGLFYNSKDNSFDFEPVRNEQLIERVGTEGLASLAVGMLQIEVGVGTSIALFVWGYSPQISWKLGDLPPVDAQPGSIKVVLVDAGWRELNPGISLELVGINEWPSVFDPKNGWFCIGSQETSGASQCIEFATATVAVMEGGTLRAVWLHPIIR